MKILIAGDSFAADWSKKYPDGRGWPNLLNKVHDVTNVAQAGSSEYRIYKQLKSVNLDKYDVILISHTSPYRLYTEYHPAHQDDLLHAHCDLLYPDIEFLAKTNSEYESVRQYFEKFFNIEYADFCYQQTLTAINQIVIDKKVLHLSHIQPMVDCIDFSKLFKTHRGLINHYNDQGNEIVYNKILEELK